MNILERGQVARGGGMSLQTPRTVSLCARLSHPGVASSETRNRISGVSPQSPTRRRPARPLGTVPRRPHAAGVLGQPASRVGQRPREDIPE